MADRIVVNGFSLIVSAVDRGAYWQGVVHIYGPDGTHIRTIETAARTASTAEAEDVALRLGTSFVQALVSTPA